MESAARESTTRETRSRKRVNYRELTNIKLPRRTVSRSSTKPSSLVDNTLYRLRVVEEDKENSLVKVRYVGYGSERDEWRASKDIVVLNETDSSGDDSDEERDGLPKITFKPFCLYDELGYQIKSCLMSDRKRDPLSRIRMAFDTIYFDGLAKRGTIVCGTKYYTIVKFSAFEDILGSRWFIRGLNSAGDFCYIKPRTVKFHLKKTTRQVDYQLREDGTLTKQYAGALVFEFVRGDGTLNQWSSVLRAFR